MARYLLISLAVICGALTLVSSASAQPSPNKPSDGANNRAATKTLVESEAARLKKARLAFAIQLVSSLADEARGYKEQSLKVRVQARAADALWNVDRERARALFARAWETAESVDEEGRRRNREERERFLSRRGGTGFIPAAPNLRADVLRLVSLHDRALAETFLAKMEDQQKRDEEERKEPKSWDPTEPPEAIAKRLSLARQMLENGETDKALLIAEPALNRATSQGLIFLVLLRQKRAAPADQLFSSLLERTATDPTSDATSVSVLSSYVFTPSVLATCTRNGVVVNQWTTSLPPPQLSPALRAKFLAVAEQILLRPASPAELETTSAGLAGTYFTVQRLLPLVEPHDPDMALALQGRLNALADGRAEILPAQHRALINAGFTANEKKEKEPDDPLAQIERARSTKERDDLYATAAATAVKNNDPKAREFADKIYDEELRKSVRGFVDFLRVNKLLEEKDWEKALQLARAGELSHLQRAWSLAEIAGALKSSAKEQASDLIREAATVAERIPVTSSESAEAWVAIAKRAAQVDPARKWQTVFDAIKAVNNAPGYTGHEHELSIRFQAGNDVQMMHVAAPSINLAALFESLAAEDIYRAADMARSINNESARAIALLAVAGSGFESRQTN